MTMGSSLTRGLPPERVGWLLARARRWNGASEGAVAERLGVPVRVLRRWERGEAIPNETQLRLLATIYEMTPEELLPARDVAQLDPDAGLLTVGDATVTVDLESSSNEQILRRYVDLVRQQRRLRSGSAVVLRSEDIAALAAVLDLDDRDLLKRLQRIVGVSSDEAVAIRNQLQLRRLAAPLAGLALGAVGLFGVVKLITDNPTSGAEAPIATSSSVPDVGTTLVPSNDGQSSDGGSAEVAAAPEQSDATTGDAPSSTDASSTSAVETSTTGEATSTTDADDDGVTGTTRRTTTTIVSIGTPVVVSPGPVGSNDVAVPVGSDPVTTTRPSTTTRPTTTTRPPVIIITPITVAPTTTTDPPTTTTDPPTTTTDPPTTTTDPPTTTTDPPTTTTDPPTTTTDPPTTTTDPPVDPPEAG